MRFSRHFAAFATVGISMMLTNAANAQCSTSGPGTEMTKMINRAGLGSDCGRCKALAAQMDRGGPAWVRQNFDWIVAQTISNAENLGHRMGPVRKVGVRTLVRTAVRRSR